MASLVQILMLGLGQFNDVPVSHPSLNPHPLFCLESPFLAVHTSFHYFWIWLEKKQQRQLYLEVTGRKSSLLNSLKWALSQVLELVSSLVMEGDNLYLIFIPWISITLLSLDFHLMGNLFVLWTLQDLREVTTCLVIHMWVIFASLFWWL